MLSLQMWGIKWMLRVVKWTHRHLDAAPIEQTVAVIRTRLGLAAALMIHPWRTRVTAVRANGVAAYLLEPPNREPGRMIYYLHGGGYVSGGYSLHKELVTRLARVSRATVLFLDYRLAPEHPYPAALDDAIAGYRWLLDTYQLAGAQVTLAGDSAGGGLCLATMAALKAEGLPMPAAAALMSPWTDLTCSGESFRTVEAKDPMLSAHMLPNVARSYAGTTDPATPGISPLFGDLSGLPPLLVQVGDEEILLDDSLRLTERARAAGVDVTLQVKPELFHVFQAAYPAPEAWTATREIGAFFTHHWQDRAELTLTVPAAQPTPVTPVEPAEHT